MRLPLQAVTLLTQGPALFLRLSAVRARLVGQTHCIHRPLQLVGFHSQQGQPATQYKFKAGFDQELLSTYKVLLSSGKLQADRTQAECVNQLAKLCGQLPSYTQAVAEFRKELATYQVHRARPIFRAPIRRLP